MCSCHSILECCVMFSGVKLSIRSFVLFIKFLKYKVLEQPDVKDILHKLHANYVLVPADKAANNVIFVCKKTI